MPEAFSWSVVLADGPMVSEEEAGSFAAVAHRPVRTIILDPHAGSPPVFVRVPEGARPIFFRRRKIVLDPAGEETDRRTITCAGYQTTEGGRNRAVYLFVFEDGTLLLTDRHDAV